MATLNSLRKVPLRTASGYTPPGTDPAVQSTLRRMLWEGAPSDIVLRIVGTFLTPLALALRATTPQIGLLNALPYLFGSVAQLSTHWLVERTGSRKRFFAVALVLSGLVWVPIALLPWVFGPGKVWWLVGLVTLAVTLFLLPSPAWGSWVGQLLPVERRGRFIGARATLASLIGALTVLGLGRFLDLMHNHVFVAFSLIFFGAMLLRFVSLVLLGRTFEPAMPTRKGSVAGFGAFLREMPHSNLGRFMGINALLNFAVCLAGPFFAVLMLRDLGFSYTTFVLLQLVTVAGSMVGMQFWGRVADTTGNVRVLRFAAPLMGLMPLGWLVSQSPWWLAGLCLLGGFAWAGYALASINFVYELSDDQERARNVGYSNAFAGVGICAGGLVGGLVAPIMPSILPHSLLTLILISGVLRLAIGLFLMPMVKEVRNGISTPTLWRLAVLHLAPAGIRRMSLRRARS